jgi:arabinosaccharide transport system substrate-binding protein
MLCYRRDLVEQLGIDVNKLTTWEEFCRVGREIVTKDLDGDGVKDRYMIDLPVGEAWALRLLLLQRGVGLFDESGATTFDDERAVDVVCWYVRQTQGKDRIAFPCGWGQNLSKSIMDGLCLFYLCPDWRTGQFQADVPGATGKLSLMPLPAWESGGRRTSSWGGTGLAFTKQSKNFELAWKLAMYLYYDPPQLGPRFREMNILPPIRTAWDQPEINEPRSFYSGVAVGRVYADLADQVPETYVSAYMQMTEGKLLEALANTAAYYNEHGEEGLREYAQAELKRCADHVRTIVDRNVFLKEDRERQ